MSTRRHSVCLPVAPERKSIRPRLPRQAAAPRTGSFAAAFVLALIAGLLGLIAAPQAARAHELRPMIATIDAGARSAQITVSLNLEAAIAGIGAEHANTEESPEAARYDSLRALSSGELKRTFAEFGAVLTEGLSLHFGDRMAELSVARLAIPETGDVGLPRISEIVLEASIPAGASTVAWAQPRSFGDAGVRLRAAGSTEVLQAKFLPAGESSGPMPLGLAASPLWTTDALSYLRIGFEHIIPKGIDHILFVVGIFLLSPQLRRILTQVTAFTLAHTVTLALGILGIVSVPPAVVEPLIAASIAWIAVENLRSDRLTPWRPAVVFGFGLLHGLGFAAVLGDVGLPEVNFATALVAFNLGVELGQLTVIACCFLLTAWMLRSRNYRRFVAMPASVAIACVAIYWVIQRVDLGSLV
jgi:hydrogenase/urease accessory protein HupE